MVHHYTSVRWGSAVGWYEDWVGPEGRVNQEGTIQEKEIYVR